MALTTFASTLTAPLVPQLIGTDGIFAQVQAYAVVGFLVLGILRVARGTGSILRFIWRQMIRPGKKLSSYGKWAVVTGATDGIGRAYCNSLAKQGMNIYLISRTEAKLQAAATEIKEKYGVETQYFAADLSAAGTESLDAPCWYGLRSNISAMDIGVLVNNAGMSYEHPQYFHQLDQTTVENMCSLNNSSLVKMTYTVLPGMLSRGRGALVNISSGVASFVPSGPLLATYAASKAFVDSFSLSLAEEYRNKGIDVQVQIPGHVSTKMSKIRKISTSVPSPSMFANAAVKHIGYETRSVPWFFHAVEAGLYKSVPSPIVTSMMKGMLEKQRDRALKKKANAAKTQ